MILFEWPDREESPEEQTHDYYGDIILLFKGTNTKLDDLGYTENKHADAMLNTMRNSLTGSEICFVTQKFMDKNSRRDIYMKIVTYLCNTSAFLTENIRMLHTNHQIVLPSIREKVYKKEVYLKTQFEKSDVSIPLIRFLLWSYYCMLLDYHHIPEKDMLNIYSKYAKGHVETMHIVEIINNIIALEKEHFPSKVHIDYVQGKYTLSTYSEILGEEIITILQ